MRNKKNESTEILIMAIGHAFNCVLIDMGITKIKERSKWFSLFEEYVTNNLKTVKKIT